MRYIVSIFIGLLAGAMLATMGMKYLQEQNAWPRAVMTVLGAEMQRVRAFADLQECNAPESVDALEHLALVGGGIDRALLGEHQDRVFSQYSTNLLAAVDKARAALPDCASYSAAIVEVRNSCSACHRDYR